MADGTSIEWTDATWSPVTGCTRISEGCLHCYIETTPPFRMERRRFDSPEIGGTTGVRLHEDRMFVPMHWRKPRRIFVCSLADLFHKDVPDEYIAKVFSTMARTPQHTYQVLTKRSARLLSLLSSDGFRDRVQQIGGPEIAWPLPNVWVGVSVETQKWADIRVPDLLGTPAAVRWISAEPLLGPVDLRQLPFPKWSMKNSNGMVIDAVGGRYGVPGQWQAPAVGLNWIVVGGESGPGARPMHPEWARDLRDQCAAAGRAYHFKQVGAWTWSAGRGDRWFDREPDAYVSLDGRTADEATALADGGSWQGVWKVGKKAAGRLLDDVQHDGYPAVSGA